MNIIDIMIMICFALSIFFGLREGLIRQLGALVGLIAGVILANVFGLQVGLMLGIASKYAALGGYAIIFVLCIICVSIIAKLLRSIVSAVGLGFLDRLGGAVVSLIKSALIMSILLSLFSFINSDYTIVDKSTIKESKLYMPTITASQYVMPAVDWVTDQIPVNE